MLRYHYIKPLFKLRTNKLPLDISSLRTITSSKTYAKKIPDSISSKISNALNKLSKKRKWGNNTHQKKNHTKDSEIKELCSSNVVKPTEHQHKQPASAISVKSKALKHFKSIGVGSRGQYKPGYTLMIPSSHKLQFNDTNKVPSKLFLGTCRLSTTDFKYKPLTHLNNNMNVPSLKHQLSRVLFAGPGTSNIQYLKDPRTGVFNYTPYLSDLTITHPSHFDFNKISPYVTSSKDVKLAKMSRHYGMKYFSSTSSMTGLLSQLHFFISNFRPVDLKGFSKYDNKKSYGFATRSAKLPAIVIVKKQPDPTTNQIYSIDSDKSCDRETILSLLGNSLERFLTMTESEFAQYLKSNEKDVNSLENDTTSYHYAQVGNFLLRSQLDCYDSRLPGTGTFDLKTRAVSALRFDIAQASEREHYKYQLNKPYGSFESYESELIDLYKSTLLKYSLQARIGNMDGIFVAFHNAWQMFGFKYLPLVEIDEILHSIGSIEKHHVIDFKSLQETPDLINKYENKTILANELAIREFTLSIQILDKILNLIQQNIDGSYRLILNTQKLNDYESKLIIIAVPLTMIEMDEIQSLPQLLKDNITQSSTEQLSKKLTEHLIKVQTINKTVYKDSGAQGYSMLIKHEINDRPSKLRHVSLSSKSDCWDALIKTHKLSKEEIKQWYFKSLAQKVELLQENFIDDITEQNNQEKDADFDELRTVLKMFARKGQNNYKEELKSDKEIVWNQE